MKRLICVFIILGLTAIDINAMELKIVAEDYPPLKIVKTGDVVD